MISVVHEHSAIRSLPFMCQSVNFYGNKRNRNEENEIREKEWKKKTKVEALVVDFAFYDRDFSLTGTASFGRLTLLVFSHKPDRAR